LGEVALASGGTADWKIDCDHLTDGDWAALALLASRWVPPFFEVHGVPRGGLRFAEALQKYVTPGAYRRLVAEDVVTTGRSALEFAKTVSPPEDLWPFGYRTVGVCVFARGACPDWIRPLFRFEGGRP
jgi:hypothetical protein